MRAFALLIAISLIPASAVAQDDATRASARAHFSRGVELYDEGRLAQAVAEFREAYRLAPGPAVLFNIAQVEGDLGHAVEAVDAYEQIMADSTVTSAMRVDSQQALTIQRARVATLRVTVNAAGARIAVDDVEVGTAPLGELRVSEGEHVVTARADGYGIVSYRFVVAGGATHEATLTLTLAGTSVGSLQIEARVPGLPVLIDGSPYGLTPLVSAIALSAGSHHVEARRPGYTLFAQDVVVAPGGESHVSIVVEADPSAPPSSQGTLRLALPTTSTQLRIDGAPADSDSAEALALPAGLHDIEVRAAEREPYARRVDVLAQEIFDLRPPYEWTPDAREAHLGAGRTQRDIGIGLIVGGGAAAVAGLATLIAGFVYFEQTGRPFRAALDTAMCRDVQAHPEGLPACRTVLAPFVTLAPDATRATDQILALFVTSPYLTQYNTEVGVGATVGGLGLIALVVGVVTLATVPSERDVDAAARASRGPDLRFSVGPSSFTLLGSF